MCWIFLFIFKKKIICILLVCSVVCLFVLCLFVLFWCKGIVCFFCFVFSLICLVYWTLFRTLLLPPPPPTPSSRTNTNTCMVWNWKATLGNHINNERQGVLHMGYPRNWCCLALNWADKGERSEVYWTVIGATCKIIQLLSTDVSQACASHASTAQATLQCPGPGGTQTSCECWYICTSLDGILCLTPVIITHKTTVFVF